MSWEEKFFDILGEMKEDIGNLKAQNGQILEQTKRTNGTLLKHEERLRILEAHNATYTGAERVKSSISLKYWGLLEKIIIMLLGIIIGKVWK